MEAILEGDGRMVEVENGKYGSRGGCKVVGGKRVSGPGWTKPIFYKGRFEDDRDGQQFHKMGFWRHNTRRFRFLISATYVTKTQIYSIPIIGIKTQFK